MKQSGKKAHEDRELIAAEDVREIVALYALARPISVRPLGLGSRSNAKSRLTTPRGDFLLKRRAPQRSGAALVEFVHSFQRHLEARAVQIAPLVLNREGKSAVQHGGHIYEMFGWVHGGRWTRSTAEARDAGIAFGRLLRAARGYTPGGAPRTVSFHAHEAMRAALAAAPRKAVSVDPDSDIQLLRATCARLAERSARAAEQASSINPLPRGVVHGDLHPGNVLFEKGRLQAILDFDGARLDWRVCEIANAALHFGNDPISGVAVEEWDPALDVERVRAMIDGAENGMGEQLVPLERAAIPWLMIEAATLESVVPIVRTGRFGQLRADRLLEFVDKKAAWIEQHANEL